MQKKIYSLRQQIYYNNSMTQFYVIAVNVIHFVNETCTFYLQEIFFFIAYNINLITCGILKEIKETTNVVLTLR